MDLERIFHKLTQHKPTLYHKERIQKYAVLLPLLKKRGEPHLLFEVRSMNLRRQPGDVCFPGGRVEESDADEMQGALRETEEELGISSRDISRIYPLDYMMISPELMIFPFVGHLREDLQIKPNKTEVERTFTIPLSFFLETEPLKYQVSLEANPEEDFPYHLIVGGENYDWRPRLVNQYFYIYKHQVIWGLTAKIILNFLALLKKEE